MRSFRQFRRRVHMAWAVSGQVDMSMGCLMGYLWYRLAAFFVLLCLRLFCALSLMIVRFSGDAQLLEDTQHVVAQLTPLLFLED